MFDDDMNDPESITPEVDALIKSVMKQHPGVSYMAQAVYYEAVHQELAPMARKLERQRNALFDALDDMMHAFCLGDDWQGTPVYDNARRAMADVEVEP